MKRLLLLILGAITFSTFVVAQTRCTSKVVDNVTGKPLQGVTVMVYGPIKTAIKTNNSGDFDLSVLPNGTYTITFSAPGYESLQIEWKRDAQKTLPVFRLESIADDKSVGLDHIMTLQQMDDDQGNQIRSSEPLLISSRDAFNNAASYNFSAARYNARGLGGEYAVQYFNGVPMNDLNTGYGVWSLWGGLNDVLRNQLSSMTFEPLEVGFGGAAVSNNLITRASNYGKKTTFTYSSSNRTYTNRLMATYASGSMPGGWAFVGSLSRRWGNGLSSYVRGVFYDATSAFLSVEKKLGEHNSLNLTALVAPTRRGVASGSTQEAYDLVGSNFYNPNVGVQTGECGPQWRNARVKSNFEPLVQLSHYFDPSPAFHLVSTISWRGGWNKYSALNWYNAPDPRPDYYRYLPSYFTWMARPGSEDPAAAALYKELWLTSRDMRYLSWDQFYQINRNNDRPVYDSQGHLIMQGKKAALYMIEDRHTDQNEWSFTSNMNWSLNDWISLDGGFNYRHNVTSYYDEVGDLLGADYVYDIDKFADRDFGGDAQKIQIDLNHPDHIAYKGDKFGYYYKAYLQNYNLWLNGKYDLGALQAYTAFSVNYSTLYREGMQRRGLFPDNSFGNSKKLSFVDFGGKLGLTYKINGHHYLALNALAMQKAPVFRNVFVSPRTRNTEVSNLKSQNIFSVEGSYIMRMPFISGRITGYYDYTTGGVKAMSFYDDTHAAFSNLIVNNISTRNMGVELGLEAKLSTTLFATGACAIGQFQYANNPDYVQTVDNSSKVIAEDIVYWKGLNTGSGPQTVGSIGLTYRAPWYGTFGITANYFGRNYISMNPAVRTDVARAQLDPKFIKPEQLKGGMTIDIFAGYSYMLSWGKYLRFNLSISNVLNNKNIMSGGYEQLRILSATGSDGQPRMIRPFPSKYFYMYGTTFFFNTTLQF